MIEISVVIPAYNEEKRIPKTLREITAYLKSRFSSYEVIVVDDGSADGTYELCRDFLSPGGCGRALRNEQNCGKGYSVRKGMLSAQGRLRLFSDADMSTPIQQLERLHAEIRNGYDIVIGSRSLSDSDIKLHQPLYRELMGKVFNRFVQSVAVRGIIDTQCGFKLFTAKAANDIFVRQISNGFSFDVEALFIADKLGYRVKEIPVTWINSPESKVSPVTDSARMLLDLFLIRTRNLRGIYR